MNIPPVRCHWHYLVSIYPFGSSFYLTFGPRQRVPYCVWTLDRHAARIGLLIIHFWRWVRFACSRFLPWGSYIAAIRGPVWERLRRVLISIFLDVPFHLFPLTILAISIDAIFFFIFPSTATINGSFQWWEDTLVMHIHLSVPIAICFSYSKTNTPPWACVIPQFFLVVLAKKCLLIPLRATRWPGCLVPSWKTQSLTYYFCEKWVQSDCSHRWE